MALAIGLAACLNAALLWRGLARRGLYRPGPGWAGFPGKLGLAVLLMAAALWALAPPDAQWLAMQKQPLLRAAWLGGVVGAGALVYFAVLGLLGFRLADFRRTGN